MTAERNKTIALEIIEALNRGEVEALGAILASDFVEYRSLPGPAGQWDAAFPDLTIHIRSALAEHNHVVVHYLAQGTNQGEFLGITATGKSVEWTGVYLARFTGDGKLAELWIYDDVVGVLGQLGESIT